MPNGISYIYSRMFVGGCEPARAAAFGIWDALGFRAFASWVD